MNRLLDAVDSVRNRGIRSLIRNSGVRAAAGITAMSVLAIVIFGGAQVAVSTSAAAAAKAQMDTGTSTDSSQTQDPNKFMASVEKVVTVAARPDGAPNTTSVWAQTSATGSGSSTVTVPIGTPDPVNLTSFSRLTTEGDSIIYPISTDGSDVVQDVVNGGSFNGEIPVEVDVSLKVNGQEVDPDTATDITGEVELTYDLINKTASEQTLSFKDANGNVISKELQTAVPFSASLSATFDKGWANIQAPWAQSGYSSGLTVTGSATLSPTMLNKFNPNAQWVLKATTENASLPSAVIKFVPKSSSGDTTVDGAGQEAAKITQMIEGAGTLLAKVQKAVGSGATELDKILKTKVDPILNMLSKLRVNPDKMEALLTEGGQYLTEGGDYLLGINALIYQYAADATATIAAATDKDAQSTLTNAIAAIEEVELILEVLAEALPTYVSELTEAAAFLAANVPTTSPINIATYICPGGASSCTWGEALGGLTTDTLVPTCTTGLATNNGYLGGNYGGQTIQQQLAAYVTSHPSNTQMAQLKTYLDAQAAVAQPANCTTTSGKVATSLSNLFQSAGDFATLLEALEPIVAVLIKDLAPVVASMKRLLVAMPGINANMTAATPLLQKTAQRDAQAEELLNEGIRQIIASLRPVVRKLADTANLLGAAALPLEDKLNELPGLIDELGNGTLGFFLGEVENLADVGNKLTIAANESAAVTVAADTKFYAGEGIPYGMATGDSVETSGSWIYRIASAEQEAQKTWPTVIFAIIMLIGSAGVSVWLTRRHV